MIRHCVERSNVDEDMKILDPLNIRHVIVKWGKIESMSGPIDPASHLNLDFPDHKVTECVIAERFEKGAPVVMDDRGLLFALVQRSAYSHYGKVDYTARLIEMTKAVRENLAKKENES